MTTLIHSFSSRQVLCIDHIDFKTVGDLKSYLAAEKGIPKDAAFFVCNGRIVSDTETVEKNVVYHTHLRLPGGKGGFGSMLRAIGAQIEKTTNHEACRDLSGRRMRDVNNEKDLKEWLGKQAEREREREQKRQDRIARRRAMPNHKFDDPLYDQQRSLLAENQEDALQTGLKKFVAKPGTSATVTSEEMLGVKRKSETQGPGGSGITKKKKDVEWLGVDIDNLSDLDSDEDTSNSEESGQKEMAPSSEEDQQFVEEDSDSVDSAKNNASQEKRNEQDSSENETNSTCKTCNKSNMDTSSDHDKSCDIDSKTNEKAETEEIVEETNEGTGPQQSEEKGRPFCLDDISSIEELVQLGLDRLKQELLDRGLKCGGTLEQRAERLFSVKGLSRDQINPDLFAKSANGKKVKNKK
ncbi:splicing regulator SDE2-like [Mercenaria mercenaria]|uniref:splicing regulator SDE2-like n=1 Tax=Mercenaria mercenaria TaxID=6596 RepID=UPI00234F2B11|nr:splicing regulator SDE2-like [Mercenaria mercenaria]